VKEAPGGAHRDPKLTIDNVGAALRRHLAELKAMSPEAAREGRYQKFGHGRVHDRGVRLRSRVV